MNLEIPLINLWGDRSFIINFAWMNIKIKYRGTYLGLVWTALEPALMFLLLYTVFTGVRNNVEENFGMYLLSGVVFHQAFTTASLLGLSSIRSNSGILKSLNIKKEILPVTAVVTASILIGVKLGVFFGLMPFFNFVPIWTIVYFPLVLLLFGILILGISYLLSIIFVYVKDIQSLWTIILLALFFVSPIFWYIDDANETMKILHAINPLGQIIELNHKVMILGEIPSISDWAYSFFLVILIFGIGILLFKKLERKIVEVL